MNESHTSQVYIGGHSYERQNACPHESSHLEKKTKETGSKWYDLTKTARKVVNRIRTILFFFYFLHDFKEIICKVALRKQGAYLYKLLFI